MTDLEFQQFKEFMNELKYEILTLDDYETLFNELGGNIYSQNNNEWIMKTICHNLNASEGKNKLYFYPEDRVLHCYTECSENMDIIELIRRRFELLGEPKTLIQSVKWICNTCSIPFKFKDDKILAKKDIYNWKSRLGKYIKNGKKYEETINDIYIDENILNYFNNIYHESWIEDGISIETMNKYEIGYYTRLDCITIPCRNIEGKLIGVRGRMLNPQSEAKYLPVALLNGTSFKFPTNEIMYGLYQNQEAIKKHKKVILFESEKSVLQTDVMLGNDNFSLALYGKGMSEEKRNILIELGVNEVVIALDFDYSNVGYYNEEGEWILTPEFEKFHKNAYRIGDYFKGFCKCSVLISYQGHKLKSSPSDLGTQKYLELYKEREELY